MAHKTRIDIDEEVWAALQQQAAPFVDTPNDVLRRVLGLNAGGPAAKHETSMIPAPTSTPSSYGIKARPKRLPRGERTPQEEFYGPVLRATQSLGGKARVAQILENVEQLVRDRLRPVDLDILDSGEVRWRKTAQFARNDMANKRTPPLLNPSSPHGWWEITEAGRQFLASDQR
ncbi:MAG: winged helix-turn-helix domain-containing protein [Dehalococcoidia bacterium]